MSQAAEPVRIYLLDDHEIVRRGLRAGAVKPSGGQLQHRRAVGRADLH